MKKEYTRSLIEHEKIKLLSKIREFLISNTPEPDEEVIITNAMEYIVRTHNSFEEQYFRILTYQYAIDGFEHARLLERPEPTVTAPSTSGYFMFDEDEPTF
ncbi:MAG: hypothetical protein UEA60_09830 [Lachnospiraceae bacterium]|nr:hypothetical protein [Lachnospiraceae bacterium]